MTFSQTNKVGNNGINANFLFPYISSFLHYLDLKVLVNVKSAVSWQKGLSFNAADFISLLNCTAKMNIGILVLWKHLFHQFITSMISFHCFIDQILHLRCERNDMIFLFLEAFFVTVVKVWLEFRIQTTNKNVLLDTHDKILMYQLDVYDHPADCLKSFFKERNLFTQPLVELNTLPNSSLE